jgi:probable AcnD-accessory protein PrpF
MRGGTSKGVFFRAADLPADPAERERILLRVIGSPDPYGKQIDGMGAATSSTSKIAILAPSKRADCDVDYLFGQVAIDRPLIDWSGNCGNLTAAVGPFAVAEGWVRSPGEGEVPVRIWQQNISKRILAHVPVREGVVVEEGDFVLDGVTFPAAEIRIEFLDAGEPGELFPTGQVREELAVPGIGPVEATLISAGNPTVFVAPGTVGLAGTELQPVVNGNADVLAKSERIRAVAAVAMGLAKTAEEASTKRLHTPKIAFVSPPQAYVASSGKAVAELGIDLTIRMLSMGQLHHVITGTGAVATAVASAIPGTVVNQARRAGADPLNTRLGHPSGVLAVGAEVRQRGGGWQVERVVMSRSARRLMEGWVRVPAAS